MTTTRINSSQLVPGNRAESSSHLSANDELEMGRIQLSRPSSASSRHAWADDGGIDNPLQHDLEESLNSHYDGTVALSRDPAGPHNVQNSLEGVQENLSCWQFIKKVIRGLWATRLTEETRTNREMYVRTTMRELAIYVVFLVILCVLTFGMTGSTMFYYTKVMNGLFMDTSFYDGSGTFRTMTQIQDFWKFAQGPLMDGLYWDTWYNHQNVTDDEHGFIFYENKLLGLPRMRQLRVRNDSCIVHDDFKNEIRACYDVYSENVEEKKAYGKINGSAWTYQTEKDLDGSSHWGLIATYAGGGYTQDLALNKEESITIIEDLKRNLWLDRGSRVVFIDFTVYNANINLFCVVRLVVEFPATGGAMSSSSFRTVKLIRYVTPGDYFVLACEGIFILFIMYYIVEESLEIKKHRSAYLKSIWSILDLVVIGISVICAVFSVYRTISVDRKLEGLLKKPDQYPDFEFLSFWQMIFNDGVALLVFFAWVKVFKYISFNKTMTQLSSTLSRCAKDVAGFGIMFFIIFFAFAQLGYLLFGSQVKDFSTFGNASFTLIRIILGDFDFHQLEEANRVMGPIFFFTYVFFVFFVLLNMFLAIINDTYAEVKAEISQQKNEFEITDYFKKRYNKMLTKLHLKRDKIIDIQKALQTADINQDKLLDFDEWRETLKTRGYSDMEIETVFAKYDLDGDRVLDEEEQRKMQEDLAEQRAKLSNEIENEMQNAECPSSDHPKSTSGASSQPSFQVDSDEEDEEDKINRNSRVNGVSYEEFTVLSRRVDRMEHSIGGIVSKVDAVLVKLEAMERAKLKRRETMGKILDSITENENSSDAMKRQQMEMLVREELERWDSESSVNNGSVAGPSPSHRPRSPRPQSSLSPSPNHSPPVVNA